MSSSQSNPAFVNHFDNCKSRIKHEMHLKVDNMVDGAYDQTLQNFFAFDESRLTSPRVHSSSGPSHFASSHQNHLNTFITQNVTHLTNISYNSTLSHLYHQHNGPIRFDAPSTHQSSSVFLVSNPSMSTNAQISLLKEVTNDETCPIPIQHETEATANEPIETFQSQHPLPLSLSSSNVNEQSNNNFNDEEICECDECQNGIGIDKEDEDDDDHSVQWIEDGQEVPSRLVKKHQQDTALPNNEQSNETRQSVIISASNQTHEPQVNNHNPKEGSSLSNQPTPPHNSSTHDKQIITLSRQCPNCPRTFAKDKLHQHMLDEHSIDRYQCAVKNCAQSFNSKHALRDHLKNSHQHTTQWHCGKCTKHFSAYPHLSNHNYRNHQLGNFRCCFTSCSFTGEYRKKVLNHYKCRHRPAPLLQLLHCEHCHYQTHYSSTLKRHRLTHLSIKPYRCIWPNCDYAATRLHYTIGHIERIHFARNSSSSSNGVPQLGHPKDYVEVLTDLL